MAIRQADLPAIGGLIPHAYPSPSPNVVGEKPRSEPVRFADKRAGVAAVWHETLSAFSNNAPSILVLALAGFAGPALVCILLSAVLRLDFYGQASGSLATWLGIGTLRGDAINPVKAMLWLQAGLGMVGLAFAHGAIAHIASRDTADAPSLGIACREAKSHLPSLLLGSLIYGVVVASGAVGVNAVLHDTDLECGSGLDRCPRSRNRARAARPGCRRAQPWPAVLGVRAAVALHRLRTVHASHVHWRTGP
jgi:hypothetical protein